VQLLAFALPFAPSTRSLEQSLLALKYTCR